MTALAANKLGSVGALEGVGEAVVRCETFLAKAHDQVERARAAEENGGVEEGKGEEEGDGGEGEKEEPVVPLEEALRSVEECEKALSDAKAKLELDELDHYTKEQEVLQLLAAARAAASAKAARDAEQEEAERRWEEAAVALVVKSAEVVEEVVGEVVGEKEATFPPQPPTAEEEKEPSMRIVDASEISKF